MPQTDSPPTDSAVEETEPDAVESARVHPDGIQIDDVLLRGLAIRDVVIASRGVAGGEVVVDLKVRIRTASLSLTTDPVPPLLPQPVDF